MPPAENKNEEAAEELVDYEEEEVAEAEAGKAKVSGLMGDDRPSVCVDVAQYGFTWYPVNHTS